MKVIHKTYFSLFVVFLFTGLALSLVYRPIVYANNINDFGFADTIGSLVSVIAFCCLVWAFKDYSNKEKNIHIIIATLIYSFGWELLGYFGFYGTFDKKDIVAAPTSGLLTLLIKTFIERRKKKA